MASNLGDTSQYGSLARAIIIFYGKLYQRDEVSIIGVLIRHFAGEDHDLNPQFLAEGTSTEDIISHYAKTYTRPPKE